MLKIMDKALKMKTRRIYPLDDTRIAKVDNFP